MSKLTYKAVIFLISYTKEKLDRCFDKQLVSKKVRILRRNQIIPDQIQFNTCHENHAGHSRVREQSKPGTLLTWMYAKAFHSLLSLIPGDAGIHSS